MKGARPDKQPAITSGHWFRPSPDREKSTQSAENIGSKIELKAQQWLKARGLKLLEQNYRCKGGEIDIIMGDGDELVFVEVRYRRQKRYGNAAESVNWQKQQKLLITAKHYLMNNSKYQQSNCRFDVIAAHPISKQEIDWEWIKNAFTA